MREHERTLRKQADYRSHLHFNLRCRQVRLTTQSLWREFTIKGQFSPEPRTIYYLKDVDRFVRNVETAPMRIDYVGGFRSAVSISLRQGNNILAEANLQSSSYCH